MNKEEKLDQIKCAKNYFFISFLISYILLLFASFICVIYHDNYALIVEKFFKLDVEDYSYLIVFILSVWKILIFQFTLIPGLALWSIEKYHCSKHK